MSDILLVNSPVKNPEADEHARMGPPLGLAYIAAVLIQSNYAVKALDLNVPYIKLKVTAPHILRNIDFYIHEAYVRSFKFLRRVITQENPSLVGISAYTETLPNALKIAEIAKAVNPEVSVVIGGPHVTFRPEDALNSKHVDIAVRGEGELTMLELTNWLLRKQGKIEEINGISFKQDNRIISTPDRPLTQNLDVLPYPARHLFKLETYPYPGLISSARGCPYQCIFCAAAAMSGKSYRTRSPENILGELLSLYHQLGINYFSFIDDTFTVYPERTIKICNLMIENGLKVQWTCSTRVNTVTKKLLEVMARSGCESINFGAESGVQSILNTISKGITKKQVRKVVKWCVDLGIRPTCSFMVPHPADTLETVKETAKFMRELLSLGANVTLAITTPFPGTYLYENAERLGLTFTSRDWGEYDCLDPVFYTKHLLTEGVYEAIRTLANL